MKIEFRLAGIPCLINVTEFYVQEGSYNSRCDSDWDYYGYEDISYEILDRKGYKAAWLEKKITSKIEDEILETIKKSFSH